MVDPGRPVEFEDAVWLVARNLGLHALIGFGAAVLLVLLHCPVGTALVAVLGIGVAHELGDGDFQPDRGGPWNGVVDVLAFGIGPFLWWALRTW